MNKKLSGGRVTDIENILDRDGWQALFSRVQGELDTDVADTEYVELAKFDQSTEVLSKQLEGVCLDHHNNVDQDEYGLSSLYNDHLNKSDSKNRVLCNSGCQESATPLSMTRLEQQLSF
jgi:hypothetical protein